MFNPVIVAAIVIQMVIAQGSRVAGAVVGFIIATEILFWGMGLYHSGYQISLLGIPLSRTLLAVTHFERALDLGNNDVVQGLEAARSLAAVGAGQCLRFMGIYAHSYRLHISTKNTPPP